MYSTTVIAGIVAFVVMMIRSIYLARTHRKLPSIVWVIVAAVVSVVAGMANDFAGAGLTRATADNVMVIFVMAAGGWGTLKTIFEHVLGITAADPSLPDSPQIVPVNPDQAKNDLIAWFQQIMQDLVAKSAASANPSTPPAQTPPAPVTPSAPPDLAADVTTSTGQPAPGVSTTVI